MSLTPVAARFIKHPSDETMDMVDSLTRLPDSAYVEIGPKVKHELVDGSVIFVEPHLIREMAEAWMREHRVG